MRKSRNIIRKRRISKRRSIFGGQVDDGKIVRACPNELEPNLKWKYGDNCYEACENTRTMTMTNAHAKPTHLQTVVDIIY